MTPEEQEYREYLLGVLRAAHMDRRVPQGALLEKGREVLRYARKHPEEHTEEDQLLLDELHGLVMWGSLLYPLSRLDPARFTEDRRTMRLRAAFQLQPIRQEWHD